MTSEASTEASTEASAKTSKAGVASIEYRTADKTAWGEGPWQTEPDKKQWQDEETGYACLIVRNTGGALCGYVGIPEGHPFHGIEYSARRKDLMPIYKAMLAEGEEGCYSGEGDDTQDNWELPAPESIFSVHGGITYSDFCQPSKTEDRGVCHVGDENVFWYGFDCSHGGDYSPQYDASTKDILAHLGESPFGKDFFGRPDVYRDLAYVTAECEGLAKQLKQCETVELKAA